MVRNATIWLVLLLVSGCVTALPSLPEGESVTPLTVADAQKTEVDQSAKLRWGGTIVSVSIQSESTVIEVVSRPLSLNGRPKHNDVSYGRFKALVNGFVEPEIFQKGRDVSFTGSVAGVEQGQVEQANYAYPLLVVDQYELWKELKANQNYDPYLNYWTHSPFWHRWPHQRPRGVVRSQRTLE